LLRSLLASLLRAPPAETAQRPPDIDALMVQAVAIHRAGDLAAADLIYADVLRVRPDHADALHLRGVIALQGGDNARAIELVRRACALAPPNAIYLNHLGEALRQTNDLDAAVETLESAVALDPDSASAWNNLGAACIDLGLASRALVCYRKAIALKPDNAIAHSNLLMSLNLVPGIGNEERLVQHRLWAERHADPLTPERGPPVRPRGARKLRIGYVSPDFRQHALAPFIAPVLQRHDRSRFEVFAYSSTPRPDAVTAALREHVDAWREISGIQDAAATEMVRADGIDILVDLAGHTNGNRLGVFARRPAPMQVTMLGYPFSTGMRAMDFRVTDAVAEADPRAASWNREQLMVMPKSLWCFRPWPSMPEVTPLPAAANGHVTFVSLNNPGKLNDEVLETWATILLRVPDARLRLMLVRPGRTSSSMVGRLMELGVDPARIITHERAPSLEFWRQAQASDIALDPFPCNGGATTCESLWLGLPVVALIGDHFVARASCSILRAATIGELACSDRDAYVERACTLAGDVAMLAEMRAGMRKRLLESALLDEPGYVGALESLFLQAWDDRSKHA